MGSNQLAARPVLRSHPTRLTPFPPPRLPAFPNGVDPEITLDWVQQVHKAARERQIIGMPLTPYEKECVVDALAWMVEERRMCACDER